MTIKKTGGGRFSPAGDRYVYIGAGTGGEGRSGYPPFTLVATNDNMTSDNDLIRRFDDGQTVMLDSGIFWLTNQHMRAHKGITMDTALSLAPEDIDGFDELFTRFVTLVKKHEDNLWGYVELDQGGRDNKIKTRARLEALGLRPMPVYHPLNDGWDYFDELASSYDRICVGNIVQAHTALRSKIIRTIWERHRDYPHLWIHGLGYTPNALLHSYPFDSVDSSTWLGPVRWWHLPKMVSADLENISDHQGETHQIHRVRRNRVKSEALMAWTVHSATMQWRAHAAEMAALGIEGLPPRAESEVAPCPSA